MLSHRVLAQFTYAIVITSTFSLGSNSTRFAASNIPVWTNAEIYILYVRLGTQVGHLACFRLMPAVDTTISMTVTSVPFCMLTRHQQGISFSHPIPRWLSVLGSKVRAPCLHTQALCHIIHSVLWRKGSQDFKMDWIYIYRTSRWSRLWHHASCTISALEFPENLPLRYPDPPKLLVVPHNINVESRLKRINITNQWTF